MFVVWHIVLICEIITVSYACNGYNVTVKSARTCDDDGVVVLHGKPQLYFDRFCNIIPLVCLRVNKAYKKFDLNYKFVKNKLKQHGVINLCQLAKRIPNGKSVRCPVEEGNICVDGNLKYSMKSFAMLIPLLVGEVSIKLIGDHDVGTSCFEGLIEFYQV